MALILCIETSGANCSVALCHEGQLLGSVEKNEPNAHAASLHVFIDRLLRENNVELSQLDAICVSKGPGSYTGLRIGVSSAKGLCFGLNIPLISVPTLLVMAEHMRTLVTGTAKPLLLCPALDARRMEIYTAFYNTSLEAVKPVSADILDTESYSDYFGSYHLFFAGDGAEKCSHVFALHPDTTFMPQLYPSATFACRLATEKYRNREWEDLAAFEPFYLKDFVATTPRNKLT